MKPYIFFLLLFLGPLLLAQTFTEVLQPLPFEGVSASSCAFADVDNDGDQYALISGRTDDGSLITKLYLNNDLTNR